MGGAGLGKISLPPRSLTRSGESGFAGPDEVNWELDNPSDDTTRCPVPVRVVVPRRNQLELYFDVADYCEGTHVVLSSIVVSAVNVISASERRRKITTSA